MVSGKVRKALGDLANKPLAEAIFELRWSLDDPRSSDDSIWELLPGLFYSEVRTDYPHLETLPIAQVPPQMSMNMVRHRFRVEKGRWPLTQLGPGVLTVNETTGYTVWEDFLPRIEKAVAALNKVYPPPLSPTRAELRYINTVPFDQQSDKVADFVKRKLHLPIDPPELFDGVGTTNDPSDINLNLRFPLRKPIASGAVTIALGEKDNQPSIIWQLTVRSDTPNVPELPIQLTAWANEAHQIIDEWFMTFCKGPLLESFRAISK